VPGDGEDRVAEDDQGAFLAAALDDPPVAGDVTQNEGVAPFVLGNRVGLDNGLVATGRLYPQWANLQLPSTAGRLWSHIPRR
jgi:hypothetical protein